MKWLFLAFIILTVYCGLHKKKKSEVQAKKSGPWQFYERFLNHETCVRQCPAKLIAEEREYDGAPEGYMCMFSVSKVWYSMGVSRAFNCYYANKVIKSFRGMNYTENPNYYGFEDGAYYNLDRCLEDCKELCWNEIGTIYYYCVSKSDENYN